MNMSMVFGLMEMIEDATQTLSSKSPRPIRYLPQTLLHATSGVIRCGVR